VPETLKNEMLKLIHYNHQGVTKSQLRARECLYWHNINVDIENYVLSSDTCLNFRQTIPKEPLIPTQIPEKPWMTVGTDVLTFKEKNYLILIDYFSKFIEVGPLPKLDSASTIHMLKAIFARHGIPDTLRTDNGTNYSSKLFKQFTDSWDIKHVTSSPTYARSNGMVERCIKSFKHMMKKAEYDDKDFYLCLLEYRTTHVAHNIPSPSEILFNRQINSLLPKFCIGDKDIKLNRIRENSEKRQQKQKIDHDKTSKERNVIFNREDQVRVQNESDSEWSSGRIIDVSDKPRTYTVKLDNGSVVERNRKFLVKDTDKKKTKITEKNFSNSNDMKRPKRNIVDPKRFQEYDCSV